jgi:hypothetical protein
MGEKLTGKNMESTPNRDIILMFAWTDWEKPQKTLSTEPASRRNSKLESEVYDAKLFLTLFILVPHTS